MTNVEKANILVVDDRADKLLAFRSILEELEQNIVTARSGEEALKLILEHQFAVILLDVNMPGLDGLETAALIRRRKRSAHTPIIFITAYADEMLTAKGYSLGAVDYILAPVVPEILQTKVKVFVELFQMAETVKQQADERVALAQEQVARVAAEEANRRSTFLAQAGRIIASSLDAQTTVKNLARLVVPSLADLSAVTLFDQPAEGGSNELAWASADNGPEPSRTVSGGIPYAVLAQGVGRVRASQKSEVVTGLHLDVAGGTAASESGPQPPLHSVAFFPLLARSGLVGVLSLALHSPRRAFNATDLDLGEELASRAAIALDNALLYQKLREADHRKNEFLAMLAHELRNPLAPIRNAVEVLRRSGLDPNRLGWASAIIDRQLKQLVRLVDDLLDVSRITRGRIQLKLAPVPVADVVAAAVETSRPLIESRRQELTVSLPEQPVQISADKARLAQVLSNLLNNAAKYTPEGGQIALLAERSEGEAVFRIRDTGIGLPPEMLSNIFDLFMQGSAAFENPHGGLGIGLTLVRSLVQIHGGSVRAFSAGRNQGSEFVVRLPMLAEEKFSPSVSEQPAAQFRCDGVRVLIVDDNPDVAESTAMLVRAIGCDVQVASDGPAALQAAVEFKPKLVLLDLGLPGMDGYEVARRLRAQPGGENFLLVAASGFGREEDLARSRRAGFDHHLVKPLAASNLEALLSSLAPVAAVTNPQGAMERGAPDPEVLT